jgi:hypothetical protein
MIPLSKNILKTVKTVEAIQEQFNNFKMTTQEATFRRALLKITRNSELNTYFVNSVNKILVDEFLKILNKLGEYSKKYTQLVEKLKTNGIMQVDEKYDKLYSEIFNTKNVCQKMEGGSIEIQIQKLNNDENVNDFLDNLMIINRPIISEKFEKILKTIGKYKVLKNAVDKTIDEIAIKLKKEDRDNIQKHFDNLKKHIQNAKEQINEIVFEYTKLKNDDDVEPENTIVSQGEQPSENAPNDGANNISDDFYNALLKISIRNRNIFSRLLDQKLLRIMNYILLQLNEVVNRKKIIESYIGENVEEEKKQCIKEEEQKIDLNRIQQNILKKYQNTNFEKKIVEIIVKLVENIQTNEIDSQPFKKIVEYSFIKKMNQIEKIIIICMNEKKKSTDKKSIQQCIDDANLLKNEIKEYISEKKVVVVPSVPLTTGLSATNLLPNATNLSGILNTATKQGLENQLNGTVGPAKQLGSLQENAGSQLQGLENQLKDTVGTQMQGLENQLKGTVGTQLQGLENQLKGTVGSQLQGLENQLKGTVGSQLQGLENQLKDTVGTQMQDAAKQLGSLQENAGSQLQGLENQFKDASKIGESLGSQFKDASKIGESLGSQFKDASKIGESLGSQFKDASKIGESLGSLFKKGGKRKKITRKSSSRAFRKTRRRRQIYR